MALAADYQDMAVMREKVEGSARKQVVGERSRPFEQGAVAGQDERLAFVPLTNELIQILRHFECERSQAEIIQCQDVDAGQALQPATVCPIRTRSLQVISVTTRSRP